MRSSPTSFRRTSHEPLDPRLREYPHGDRPRAPPRPARDHPRLLRPLLQGAHNNVAFADFVDLIEGFGFELDHVTGSHHIYRHATAGERLNLQPHQGEVKPYQIRQFLRIVEQRRLELEDEA